MKLLREILPNIDKFEVLGNPYININFIKFDSREVLKGDIFVAINGVKSNGHSYISKSIENGAICIVCEEFPKDISQNITYIKVDNSSKELSKMASNFYDNPSNEIKLIGITGTNGKTTTATLSYNLFSKLGYKSGLLSTIKIMVGDKKYTTNHTTPDSILINKYLREMVNCGCQYCFMEVSSHGISQHRTSYLEFSAGVFTNITHDHLDYHNTFLEYLNVKKSFFDNLPKSSFAITNLDDKNGAVMLQNTKAKKYYYALKTNADYHTRVIENSFLGLHLYMNGLEVFASISGYFNAYNLTVVYALADILLELESSEILLNISDLTDVDGRFNKYISKNGVILVVDYAHTPDALENVLNTILESTTKSQKIITVVGCGGDRDIEKRPKMANIATIISDTVIFTSDNPRGEDANDIISQMEKGVLGKNSNKYICITDRFQAIKTACKMANNGDVVLVAGKGHEDYQIINNEKLSFNDKEIAIKILKNLEK